MKTLTLPFRSAQSSAAATPATDSVGSLRQLLTVLHRCNPVLSGSGWLHVPLVVLALALLPFDDRQVLGLNVWFKPLKFAVSDIIYLWTLAWLLADLPAAAQRSVRVISWGVGVSIVVEIVVIFLQAARGIRSHFNVGNPLDGLLFGPLAPWLTCGVCAWAWCCSWWAAPWAAA